LILSSDFKNVWFDITQTKPSRLQEIARRKKCDLVLTEVPLDYVDNDKSNVFDLPLALVAPRGHWLEMDTKAANLTLPEILDRLAKENATLCRLPDDPAFYPLPDYPPDKDMPPDLRIHRVGSTTLCLSLVMASTASMPIVAIVAPQFLTEEDLERLVVIPIEPHRSSVKMALMRPLKPDDPSKVENKNRTEVVAKVEAAIKTQVKDAIEQYQPDKTFRTLWIYHTTRIGEKSYWQKGRLSWNIRYPSNDSVAVISGSHSIEATAPEVCYIIRGRAVSNGADCHVLFRARSIRGLGEDGYVFSGLCPRFDKIGAGTLCGTWHGVFSQAKREDGDRAFMAGSGFVVICEADDAGARYLNRLVQKYSADHEAALAFVSSAPAVFSDK
jgi:hypothetical protein